MSTFRSFTAGIDLRRALLWVRRWLRGFLQLLIELASEGLFIRASPKVHVNVVCKGLT